MAGRWRPAAGRRVVSSGVGITLIVAGVFELVLSLLVRGGPRRPRSLVRQGHESRKTRNVKTLLRTWQLHLAAAPARYPRTQWQGPEFFICAHGLVPAKRHC